MPELGGSAPALIIFTGKVVIFELNSTAVHFKRFMEFHNSQLDGTVETLKNHSQYCQIALTPSEYIYS
ncbi:KLTH0A00220p [Lachancea thermotolerans CBS 6340]|uniref:KLTH0A00220p n=1 Tax=Lachancea thermotolerans (strain ATCC 56472 / CBS 6340 / NRRL Y-8284) TaxID=559295 RepID=C5DB76_LACTC|nr:KLTH0A00220p [Lachancea thermotolerans CBS 6340]CAR21033.1 KLTH0A00220p [Lachancea thermotolerans CBS 6340]